MTENESEILQRLKALEEENARLRAASSITQNARLIVTESDYKGHPTLTFDGPFRRFTLGLSKLRAIQEAWPEIEKFLDKHSNQSTNSKHYHEEDGKI